MPQQLSPSEDFPIVRVLSDHTDASTNYVRAVITDATTDVVLATLNLTDQGNRRFKKIWHVPYDNIQSRGRFIVITTTVYTDSGYTAKNPNYGEIGDTYLIQQRFDIRYLPAGGSDVDYKQVRKVISEELAALKLNELEPVEFPVAEPVDFTPHVKVITDSIEASNARAVAAVVAKVDSIKIPVPEKPQPIDFSNIERQITALSRAVTSRPEFNETDLSPIIQQLATELKSLKDTIVAEFKAESSKPKTFALTANPEDQQPTKKDVQLRRLATKHNK